MFEVSFKEFLEKRTISLEYSSYRLICDIDEATFVKHIGILFEELYYVLFFYEKEIEVVGDSNLIDDYFSISPLYLHTNPEAIDSFLYLEAWYFLKSFQTKWVSREHPYELEPLNPEQMLAVRSTKGVVWVSAPAGSGKTKTLINRVLSLLNQGVPANRILVLAYNTKAALELTERLRLKMADGSELGDVVIRTFHSFGNEILLRYTNLVLDLDQDEEKAILYEILNEKHRKVNRQSDELIATFTEWIQKIKENLLSKQEIEKLAPHFWSVFMMYLEKQQLRSTYGYEDMLYLVLSMILQNKGLRLMLQSQYEYVLVDEFQDLNPVQLRLIQVLSMPRQNLFVVGDDDQMIYSFRGSSNENTFSFMKRYSLIKRISLCINYRSYENLVRHASWLISHNLHRIEKKIESYSDVSGTITICVGKVRQQLDVILNFVRECVQANVDFVILCRYQEDVLFLQAFLLFHGYETGYSIRKFRKVRSIFLENYPTSFEKAVRSHRISGIDMVWFSLFKIYSVLETKELLEGFPRKLLGRVFVTTVHKTKGNEFDRVCYYYRNHTSCTSEEERRIFYVAATRAKESFLLCSLQVDSFVREYALNENYRLMSNRMLARKILETNQSLENSRFWASLYQKDVVGIQEKIKYQINEEKELYLAGRCREIEQLQKHILELSKQLSSLREEQLFRRTFKNPKNMI